VQLGSPSDQIRLTDVIASIRGIHMPLQGDADVTQPVEKLLESLNVGELEQAGGRTLADLLADVPPRPNGDAEVAAAASVDPASGRG
jgi:hypothetical protein